jgi:hypothetical protein
MQGQPEPAEGELVSPPQVGSGVNPTGLADLLTNVSPGRMNPLVDVAHLTVFLASDKAGHMTGSTVYIKSFQAG